VIAHIQGKVTALTLNRAIVDVAGVGYEVLLSPSQISTLAVGETVLIHTSAVIREDSWTLYGFSDTVSKELFIQLQSVSGIGPKAAYSLLSALNATDIERAIGAGDHVTLEKVPGVGKKMASRIILELKDRFAGSRSGTASRSAWRGPVIEALTGLGYSTKEAESAVDRIVEHEGESLDKLELSEILKRSLSHSQPKKK
jgi:Holliday junction DNA helicase RuvA